ncbi:ribonuclease P protein component [Vulgatibacter sp.]|uniref:ribonuclease P protein component n=1 Tax=Vulgatibacter sp. TaxID=1971226 RepID=UPI00356A3603
MEEAYAAGGDRTFPHTQRLLARRDFLRAKARGRKVHTQHLIGLWTPSTVGRRRVGLTVSSKVGNAVVRNQVKRWLREIYRHERDRLPARVDLVLIAKIGAEKAGYHALRAQFLEIARRIG